MAFTPAVTYPLCQEVLELDRTLEEHLVGSHSHRELARSLAVLHERVGLGRVRTER